MPVSVTLLLVFLSLLSVAYLINKSLKKNNKEIRQIHVMRLLSVAYLPLIFWLIISVILLRSTLDEGLWILITTIIGLIWVIGVFIKYKNR